jgi:LPXTG-site transpeptidase (sortase) family protein
MKSRLAVLLQYGCLTAGALLVSLVAFARLEGEAGRQSALEAFKATTAAPDQSLWSPERIRDYQASLALVTEAPVAILRVPDLHLEVPVFASDAEPHLNRGAGLIAGMGLPDKGGNVGIAGHRDGYFRVLKDIRPGQLIEIQTRARTHRYRVVSTEVVEQKDVHVLGDTLDPTVTLVTCYPFYFVGSAPQRFIVRGAYEWT